MRHWDMMAFYGGKRAIQNSTSPISLIRFNLYILIDSSAWEQVGTIHRYIHTYIAIEQAYLFLLSNIELVPDIDLCILDSRQRKTVCKSESAMVIVRSCELCATLLMGSLPVVSDQCGVFV
jgi:hypothetical protein